MSDTAYRAFVQSIIDNIKKNGFPDKKVSLPLEQLYEAAHRRGINLNKVLETLEGIQIAHVKTPEKIVFYPKDRETAPREKGHPAKAAPGPSPGPSPDLFAGLDPSMLGNLDASGLMQVAADMMKRLNPEQLRSLKDMYDNLSDEEKAAMIENAKKLGLM
jgi:hypothetical protein